MGRASSPELDQAASSSLVRNRRAHSTDAKSCGVQRLTSQSGVAFGTHGRQVVVIDGDRHRTCRFCDRRSRRPSVRFAIQLRMRGREWVCCTDR